MSFCCSTISKAIINNDVETFKELLNKRKRVDIADNLGYTSLHIAAKKSASSISPYIIDSLLNHPDVEINAKTVEGYTSLYVACDNVTPNIEVIQKFLANGADSNIGDLEQVSPLHLACKYRNLNLIDLLMKYKANINCQDFNSYTPLHYSIEYNFKEITEYLLKANADTNCKNLHGFNALMFAIEIKCEYADIFVIKTNDLNTRSNDNNSAILLAIKRNNINMVQLLIKYGADLSHSSEPLFQAIKLQNFDIFQLIWKNIDPRRFRKYDQFLRKILIRCNAYNDFRYLKLMISDCRLDCKFRGKRGILAFIFYKGTNLNIHYTKHYFERTKEFYFQFFQWLINQGMLLSSSDVESFIFYFCACPYRIDLLKMLLIETKPDITEHLVIYALEYDFKMATLLLQHCLDVFPDNLFDHFFHMSSIQKDFWEIVEYIMKYFTPNNTHRRKLFKKLLLAENFNNATNISPTLYNSLQQNRNNVKKLTELSRDVVRNQFQDACEVSTEFLEKVELLDVPTDVKDYITFKLPVRQI